MQGLVKGLSTNIGIFILGKMHGISFSCYVRIVKSSERTTSVICTISAVPLASSADSFSFSFSFSLSFSRSRSFGRSPQLASLSDSQGGYNLVAGEVRRLDLDLDLDLSRWRERDREGSRGLLSAFSPATTAQEPLPKTGYANLHEKPNPL